MQLAPWSPHQKPMEVGSFTKKKTSKKIGLSPKAPIPYLDSTGTILMTAAMGIPRNPMNTQTSHCDKVNGVVLAKSPRN